ncbi:MAG: immunoglobulin domain-containing protein [Phycisphaerae bacterium]|nr:immunoglobulin domain-containing protein [Phycisphaerae bacterium]
MIINDKKKFHSWVVLFTLFLTVNFQMLQPLYADEFWQAAKDYSNSLGYLVEEAVNILSDAKDALEAALQELSYAKAALQSGVAGGSALVAKATAAVGLAEAAVGAAVTGVEVATCIVAAFVAGTAAGQALDYGISQVWDPILPIAVADPNYVYPNDVEVDLWIPAMIQAGTGLSMTRADFDTADANVPGSGTAAWNFIREGARGFAIAIRGAGAFSAGQCSDTLLAAGDLQTWLPNYTNSIESFAAYLSAMQTFTGDPMVAINNARSELDDLEADYPWNPTDVPDPNVLTAAINQTRTALDMSENALKMVGDSNGYPISIDSQLLPSQTLLDFIQFLDNCKNNGVACLPQAEVDITDYFMGVLGATFNGVPSIAAEIAQWDGQGDTGNEALLFNAHGGVLTPSQVLTTAIANHWDRIDLSYSPLIQCGPARILQDPDNITGTYGGVAMFTVRAAGDPTIVYQWKKNGVVLSNGGDIAGADTASLSLSNLSLTRGVLDCYKCEVANASGSDESDCAYLTVPCFHIYSGDLNGDCVVDLKDFAMMSIDWLNDGSLP